MTNTSSVEDSIRTFILSEFLAGEDPSHLADSTPLITTGVVDSIATLRLVDFLEKTFAIAIAAHETDPEHLDTIERMAHLVRAKSVVSTD
jgi:acyl carrier protein